MLVRPAESRDLSALATIATDAMFDDELTQVLAPYRRKHPESLRQGILRRAKKRFYSGNLMLAAVSDKDDPWWNGHDQVLGYLSARSTKQDEHQAKHSWFSWNALELQLLRLEDLIVWYTFADRSISRPAWQNFFNNIAGRGPVADVSEYWDVDHLSVDPVHQRKGIGKALIKYVQDVASQDDLPIVLVASKQGYPMYQKLGFVDKGPFELGAGQVSEAMIWYPPNVVMAAPLAEADSPIVEERVI